VTGSGQIGRRGWILLACLAVAAVAAGNARTAEKAKWGRWTYSHVAWETKADLK
jgi:hypothetical protein